MRSLVMAISVCVLFNLSGCATAPDKPAMPATEQSRLPPADPGLVIPGLGPCTNSPDRALHLNSQQPVTVLVHSFHGSTGNFRALAEILAFHGQQTACFDYDGRNGLMRNSAQLAAALDTLAGQQHNKQITVIGYSLGALVSRKALVAARPDPMQDKDSRLRLVTISGPFAGIASAQRCESPTLFTRPVTLGLEEQLCGIESSDKWHEITPSSDFIRQPGELRKQVVSHLKIDTDESGACNRNTDGSCKEQDFVFRLEEQRFAPVDRTPLAKVIEVKAGHAEIVGVQHNAPLKLIGILQEYGILNQTGEQQKAAFEQLLARLYAHDN